MSKLQVLVNVIMGFMALFGYIAAHTVMVIFVAVMIYEIFHL